MIISFLVLISLYSDLQWLMLYLCWPIEVQEKCKNRTTDACSLIVIKGGFIGFRTEDANRKSRQVSLCGSTPLWWLHVEMMIRCRRTSGERLVPILASSQT